MYIGVFVFAIRGANLKLSLFNMFPVVVAKVIKWVEVFIAKPYTEAKRGNFVPYRLVRPVFVVSIDRLVHNTDFRANSNTGHIGLCTKEYIKFRPINAYRPKLDKDFPLYFSYLYIKFVPHFQDIIPFSSYSLYVLYFFKFLTLHVSSALHCCMFFIFLSLSL